jgi:hypothetical protein
MKITLVIAGNYAQFLTWCKDNHRSPYDTRIRYINSLHQLYGFKPDAVVIVKTGTWQEGPLFRGRHSVRYAGSRKDMDNQMVHDLIAHLEGE